MENMIAPPTSLTEVSISCGVISPCYAYLGDIVHNPPEGRNHIT